MDWSRKLGLIGRMMIAAAFCAALARCGGSTPSGGSGGAASTAPATAASSQPQTAADGIRIVSMSPAISRTLMDFGLTDRIIGRSPYCTFLDKNISVVGDLNNVNYEQLVRINPTHILVQPPATGLDAQLVSIAREHGWRIGQWHLDNVEDIEAMVREIPAALYPADSPELARLSQRAAELLSNIAAAMSPGKEPMFRGRTMIIASSNPVLAFGKGTYLDDVLKALGAENAVTDAGWVELSMEDVARINPEAILVIRAGAKNRTGVPEMLGPLWDTEIDAVLNRRTTMLIHPDAFWPGSTIAGVAEEVRAMLVELGNR